MKKQKRIFAIMIAAVMISLLFLLIACDSTTVTPGDLSDNQQNPQNQPSESEPGGNPQDNPESGQAAAPGELFGGDEGDGDSGIIPEMPPADAEPEPEPEEEVTSGCRTALNPSEQAL